MMSHQAIMKKLAEAFDMLRRCMGRDGVWAAAQRYEGQCWTRDFALAILGALIFMPGGLELIKQHIHSLAMRQKPNGKMPIVFFDNGLWGHLKFLWTKGIRTIQQRKMSFMFKRYLQGGVDNLTPGTQDSELMFVFALLQYFEHVSSSDAMDLTGHLDQAMAYIESELVDQTTGLMRGCDWRDTMEKELAQKHLLTNNALLYGIYNKLGLGKKAQAVKDSLLARRDVNGLLVDYEGAPRFDPLGGALAVLQGVAGPEEYAGIVRGFRSVDTRYGVTIQCKHNAHGNKPADVVAERDVIERTHGIVVWPFVVGFTVLALIQMGEMEYAHEQFEKLVSLDGFWEWYDPATGTGYGSNEQLWSATLLLRAYDALYDRA